MSVLAQLAAAEAHRVCISLNAHRCTFLRLDKPLIQVYKAMKPLHAHTQRCQERQDKAVQHTCTAEGLHASMTRICILTLTATSRNSAPGERRQQSYVCKRTESIMSRAAKVMNQSIRKTL